MDLVSIEDAAEWEFLQRTILGSRGGPRYHNPEAGEYFNPDPEIPFFSIWTSGRLCDFDGCEAAEHMKPINERGWFWASTTRPMSRTTCANDNATCFHAWSDTGLLGLPQPDDRELRVDGIDGNESCMAAMYIDGELGWHDRACYPELRFVCEDSPALMRYGARLLQRHWKRMRVAAANRKPIPDYYSEEDVLRLRLGRQ